MICSSSTLFPFQHNYNNWTLESTNYFQINQAYLNMVDSSESTLDLKLLNAFCLWNIQKQIDGIKCSCDNQTKSNSMKKTSIKSKQSYREDSKIDIWVDKVIKMLGRIVGNSSIIIHGKKKFERTTRSRRRSSYIGVSKNGPSWQSMITVKKLKTYLGTYHTQQEAAMAFDFYSILAHGLVAKTNFNYSKDAIMIMISNYKSNGDIFIPKQINY